MHPKEHIIDWLVEKIKSDLLDDRTQIYTSSPKSDTYTTKDKIEAYHAQRLKGSKIMILLPVREYTLASSHSTGF
jgi:hypothetical protein